MSSNIHQQVGGVPLPTDYNDNTISGLRGPDLQELRDEIRPRLEPEKPMSNELADAIMARLAHWDAY